MRRQPPIINCNFLILPCSRNGNTRSIVIVRKLYEHAVYCHDFKLSHFDRSVPCHTDLGVIIYYHATFYYTHLLCNILLQIEGFQFFDVSQKSKTA